MGRGVWIGISMITKLARRLMNERFVAPYILKVDKERFNNIDKIIQEKVSSFAFISKRQRIGPGIFRRMVKTRFDDIKSLALHRSWKRIGMLSTILTRDAVEYLNNDRLIEKIYPDPQMFAWAEAPIVSDEGIFEIRGPTGPLKFTSTKHTKELMGGYEANGLGYKGEEMNLAVVDTGGAPRHDQTPHLVFESVLRGQEIDENGHGQWCASCAAGRRVIDKTTSRRAGANIVCDGFAPEANLFGIKCLGYLIGTGSNSDVIEAIMLSVDKYNADVVSLSLGSNETPDTQIEDPNFEVMSYLQDNGVIPVVAAGNAGPDKKTIGSPGWLSNVLTIGAIDPMTGLPAEFSSRGPTVDGRIKPDCAAYGVNIDSGTVGIAESSGDKTKNNFGILSGTSMATPHVAGLVTLMGQAYRNETNGTLTLKQLMEMLKTYGLSKDNNTGYGIITWDMFVKYMSKYHGVQL